MIWKDLTPIINFPTWISYCDYHSSPILIYFFFLTVVSILQKRSLHCDILITLLFQFPWTFRQTPFSLYSLWLFLCRLGWSFWPFERVSKGRYFLIWCFCDCCWILWVSSARIDVYISHRKYKIKPHSSPLFSTDCAADIDQRSHFLRLCHQIFCIYSEVQKGL